MPHRSNLSLALRGGRNGAVDYDTEGVTKSHSTMGHASGNCCATAYESGCDWHQLEEGQDLEHNLREGMRNRG